MPAGKRKVIYVVDEDERLLQGKLPKGLIGEWCTCDDGGEFLCYPNDGECYCGIGKHHVHCARCNKISQVG